MNHGTSKEVIRDGVIAGMFFSLSMVSPNGAAITLEELAAKVERLEAENRALKEQVGKLASSQAATQPAAAAGQAATAANPPAPATGGVGNGVTFNSRHTYQMLDPTTYINRKHLLLLDGRKSGELAENSFTLGGAITAVVDRQSANTNGSFGYLMRQPGNAVGRDASEAVIHSAQFSMSANIGSWVTAYSETLYDPEQSFGAGTNTALTRNQLQLRSGYVLLGNLNKSPFYASLGKMATPFGLTDTVSPFSASTVWHAFGGVAYGLQGGYIKDGLNLAVMAVQGGPQFRGANTPVDATNTPSKLNNHVVNANYTFGAGGAGNLLVGTSYQKGTTYCGGFPVVHFGRCLISNPAYDVYSQLKAGRLVLQAEFARTRDPWPGTFNPALPQFGASKVTSWGLGGKYLARLGDQDYSLSVDYSRFIAGPGGAPWEKQDQLVFGVASYLTPSVKVFGEYVHVKGFVPLPNVGTNFASSGARSNVLLMGINAAY